MPVDGHDYVIGVDPSVSEQGVGFGGVQVLDCCDNLAQVAEYNAPRSPRDLARVVAVLGAMYTTALVAPERRNHGAAFIDSLVNEYGYSNVYQFMGDGISVSAGSNSTLLGIDTVSKVRDLMFQEGRTTFAQLRTKIRSRRLLDEIAGLQTDDNDRLKKIQRQRTDLWWSWCFGAYAANHMGLVRKIDDEEEAERKAAERWLKPRGIEGAFYDPAIGGYW